mgnify:CR=1 FL=1
MVGQALKLLAGIGAILEGARVIRGALGEISTSRNSSSLSGAGQLSGKVENVKDIDQRVGYVIKMVKKSVRDPRIRQLAVQIVSQKCGNTWCIKEKDYLGELKAIYQYMRSNVRYVRDIKDLDTFQHAIRTFEFKGGDCDCMLIAAIALLLAIGHEPRIAVIRTVGSPEWNHIYLQDGIPPQGPKRWIAFDASVPKYVGWEAPKQWVAERKFYNV